MKPRFRRKSYVRTSNHHLLFPSPSGGCLDVRGGFIWPTGLLVRTAGGFITMSASTYWQKLQDPRWQKKRAEILQRDKYTCRDCEATDKTLHVHHCAYDRREPWEIGDELLLTVCKDCHESRQALENDAKRALGMLFARLCNAHDDDLLKTFVTQLVQAASDPDFMPHLLDHEDACTMHELAVYGQRAFSQDFKP